MMQATMKMVRDARYRRGVFVDARRRGEESSEWARMLADAVGERRVLERYVVDAAPAKSVAAELNISLRQFYRLYTHMIEMIDAGLNRRPASAVPVTPKIERELEHVRGLLVHGRSDDAQSYIEQTLASRPGSREAIAALLLLARAHADRTEFDRAEAVLGRAARLVGEIDTDRRLRAICDITMAQSYIAYAGGFYEGALTRGEEAFDRARGDGVALSHTETRSLARDRIFLGILHQEGGDSRRSVEHQRKALDLLQSLPVPPGAELSQAYTHLAIAETAFGTAIPEALGYADEALRIAQWHGLRHEEVWAHLATSLLHMMTGAGREALRSGEAALAVARAVFKGDPLARTLFVNGRLQTTVGSARRAMELLEEARPHVAAGSILEGIMDISEARANHAAGRDDQTVAAADRAIATMEARFPTHYVGMAYWARGEVRARRGLVSASRSDAERAVHYLARGSPLPDYADALELSAAVANDMRHAQMAREVRATLHG